MQRSGASSAGRAPQLRSVDTRARILDAAVQVLVQEGYSGATTLRIQALAEVTRGRLLHHYPSRDDLLVAAVAHLTDVQIRSLAKDVTWSADPATRIDQAVATMWDEFRQPYFWASTELWLAARVNVRLRATLAPHARHLGAHIRTETDTFFGAGLTSAAGYEQTRELLISSMRGAALTYAFLPRLPETDPHVALWSWTAKRLLLE